VTCIQERVYVTYNDDVFRGPGCWIWIVVYGNAVSIWYPTAKGGGIEHLVREIVTLLHFRQTGALI
jgi:hypothetical protein